RDVPFLPAENTAGLAEHRTRVDKLVGTIQNDVTSVLGPEVPQAQRQEADLAVKKVRAKRSEALKRDQEYPKPLAMSVYDGPVVERRGNIPYHPLPEDRRGPTHDVFILTGGTP